MQERKYIILLRDLSKEVSLTLLFNEGTYLKARRVFPKRTGALFCPHYQGKKRLKSVKGRERNAKKKLEKNWENKSNK